MPMIVIVTYHDMAAWWPTSKETFAPLMDEIPKAVFSRWDARPGSGVLDRVPLRTPHAS